MRVDQIPSQADCVVPSTGPHKLEPISDEEYRLLVELWRLISHGDVATMLFRGERYSTLEDVLVKNKPEAISWGEIRETTYSNLFVVGNKSADSLKPTPLTNPRAPKRISRPRRVA